MSAYQPWGLYTFSARELFGYTPAKPGIIQGQPSVLVMGSVFFGSRAYAQLRDRLFIAFYNQHPKGKPEYLDLDLEWLKVLLRVAQDRVAAGKSLNTAEDHEEIGQETWKRQQATAIDALAFLLNGDPHAQGEPYLT